MYKEICIQLNLNMYVVMFVAGMAVSKLIGYIWRHFIVPLYIKCVMKMKKKKLE